MKYYIAAGPSPNQNTLLAFNSAGILTAVGWKTHNNKWIIDKKPNENQRGCLTQQMVEESPDYRRLKTEKVTAILLAARDIS